MRPQSILLLSLLTLAACRHDVDVQPPSPPPPTVTPVDSPTAAPTFGISGDTAVEVMQTRSVDATIFLSDSGAGKPVRLSISGLPAGVTASFTSSTVTPPGQATLRITAGPSPIISVGPFPVAPVGTFIATVLAKMDNGAEKTHSIRVTVVENPDCVQLRVGTYKMNGGSYNVYVTIDPAHPDTRIRLSNFPYSGKNFYAEVNCANNAIVIPSQTAGNLTTYSATGTFSRDTIRGAGVYNNVGNGSLDPFDFIMVRQ